MSPIFKLSLKVINTHKAYTKLSGWGVFGVFTPTLTWVEIKNSTPKNLGLPSKLRGNQPA